MNDKTAWPALDLLSPPARAAANANADAAYRRLVVRGSGWAPAKEMLSNLRPESLLARPARNPGDAGALLAGLWLWHDWLDESHQISQSIASPTGSFWHAIMHRREGDFSNSKYWYARCKDHPVLPALGANAQRVVNNMPADKSLLRLIMPAWNPAAFVDVVEQVHESPGDPRHAVAVALQKLEWQLLFDHCTRGAAGK